jgi:hypothetical protein
MPLLILYNPFDTKIKGETYYAIRVWGQFKSPVGAFRFAIGYETSDGYFQCLRDLRTEAIPSLAPELTREIPDSNYLQQFYVPFRLGANFWSKKENQANQRFFDSDSVKQTGWWLSKYTRFHRGYYIGNKTDRSKTNSNYVTAYPLGYGTQISRANPIIQQAWAKDNIQLTYPKSQWYRHWRGIVDNGNIYPSQSEAAAQAGNTQRYAARVAKIPLFLNNILYAVHTATTGQISISRQVQTTICSLWLNVRLTRVIHTQQAKQTRTTTLTCSLWRTTQRVSNLVKQKFSR